MGSQPLEQAVGNVEKALFKCYKGKQRQLVVPLVLLKLAFMETRICGKWTLAAELGLFRNMLNHCGEIFYCILLINMKLVNFQ